MKTLIESKRLLERYPSGVFMPAETWCVGPCGFPPQQSVTGAMSRKPITPGSPIMMSSVIPLLTTTYEQDPLVLNMYPNAD